MRPFANAVVQAASVELSKALANKSGSRSDQILDHGCGTGLVTSLIHADFPNLHIHAIDPNPNFLSNVESADWLSIQRGVASDLDHVHQFIGVLSNLVLMFCPDPQSDLSAIRAASQTGAHLSLSVLGPADTVQPFHIFWSAFAEEVPDGWAPDRYPHHRFAEPEVLQQTAQAAGWAEVSIAAVNGYRQIDGRAAWNWLSSALPVGSGNVYLSEIDDETKARAQRRFLRRWAGARFCRSQAWLLTAKC